MLRYPAPLTMYVSGYGKATVLFLVTRFSLERNSAIKEPSARVFS